jgi:hypothetical protein
MHNGNIDWLNDINQRFDIRDARLLELGSLSVNGSAEPTYKSKSGSGRQDSR